MVAGERPGTAGGPTPSTGSLCPDGDVPFDARRYVEGEPMTMATPVPLPPGAAETGEWQAVGDSITRHFRSDAHEIDGLGSSI